MFRRIVVTYPVPDRMFAIVDVDGAKDSAQAIGAALRKVEAETGYKAVEAKLAHHGEHSHPNFYVAAVGTDDAGVCNLIAVEGDEKVEVLRLVGTRAACEHALAERQGERIEEVS
jgi:hypothetical protein